jgi:predicted nuclease with TOPRIM domain
MFIKKYEYEELKKRIEELKEENTKLNAKLNAKMDEKLEKRLKEYDYAILVKNYKTTVYNNGRIDKRIRCIEFETRPEDIPELKIIK